MESSHLVIFSTFGKFITKFNALHCISFKNTILGRGQGSNTSHLTQYATTTRLGKKKFIMVIHNNDSGTSRAVAIMIVGKAEINASGSFRSSCQY